MFKQTKYAWLIAVGLSVIPVTAGAQTYTTGTTTTTETGVTTTPTPSTTTTSPTSKLRLTFQGRLSLTNVILAEDSTSSFLGSGLIGRLVPFVTAGVRILDERLFLGAGVGWFSISDSGNDTNDGGAAFSISPMANFDFVQDDWGALYALGWINLGTASNTIGPDFVFGVSVGLGVRARITKALAIGTEWGWGFANLSYKGPRDDRFIEGVFGNILFEASVGIL